MQAIELWLSAHPALATAVIWPLVTLLVNGFFDLVKAHESQSKALRALDAFLSAAGLDAVKAVAALKSLFGGPGGPTDPRKATTLPPPNPTMHEAPTKPNVNEMNGQAPKFQLHGAWAIGLVVVLGCLPAKTIQDIGKLSIDDIDCVMRHADKGETPEAVVVSCGLQSIPDVLAVITDLVLTRQAADKAGVAPPLHATSKDAGGQ